MLARFNAFIRNNQLLSETDRTLLAVSAGKDSVAMAHLFSQAGYAFGIVHCNFGLREKESDADEQFVEALAKELNVSFFSTRFQTKDYADSNGISIQMAARDLRYEWFETVRSAEGFSRIATAHHLDDSVETVLLNLIRGTGIRGLHGIRLKRGSLIRPLLFATAEEIKGYLSLNRLAYREDRSNSETYYLRNKLRLQIIPLLKEINPDLVHTMQKNIHRFADLELLLERVANEKKNEWLIPEKEAIHIPVAPLLHNPGAQSILTELLQPYGFSETVAEEVFANLENQSGKVFYSDTHVITTDRGKLILNPLSPDKPIHILLEKDAKELMLSDGRTIHISRISNENFTLPSDRSIACLDEDLLKFPLLIRTWRTGDAFYPLGMDQKKKLSDLFIDEKIPLPEKRKIPVLISGDDIAWVAGIRIDNRFRISSSTKKIYILELKSPR